MCAHPYTGTLYFRGIFFSDLENPTRYAALQQSLMQFFKFNHLPVDSVSLSNPRMDSLKYLTLNLSVFPYGQASFNQTGVSLIAYAFSSFSFFPPETLYGSYFFLGDEYNYFPDEPKNSKKSTIGIIIGAAVGGSVLLLLSLLAGIYAFHQKKKAERASIESNPFGMIGIYLL
ncbi:hypothetical protein SLEP1_g59534 [Rubroshorea leprosula]|uniref:Uncharacterized protein n=1 Tax=Rubroshorea leprosula TaxID=152421 RepID=A0AAV5MV45_9ROSI|nr:hypothetical protein SLEP1_g59534 [Rubroshorea leprosula]